MIKISEILNFINLNAYAESDGFCFFTENMTQKQIANSKLLIKLICLSSAHTPQLYCKFWMKEAYLSNLLKPVKISDKLKNSDLIGQFNDREWRKISIEDENSWNIVDNIFDLCVEGYTFGHIFLLLLESKIAIYPHGDGGFGVIRRLD